jgi:lipoate-protein ligase A
VEGNDILVNGEKVMGSMQRQIGSTTVWAAQFSFAEHDELIGRICKKEMKKHPAIFHKDSLTKEVLEREVLRWLQKH